MFYIRPIARDDLPAILALSERTGTGLTTLPANRERLAARIERSLASFAGSAERRRRVLRVRARARTAAARRDRVVGISAIEAAVGLASEPWYNYHVGTLVHASRAARRVHGRADAVPRQRSHRPHRALLAVPRPGVPARQERRAAREVPPPVHRRVRAALRDEGDRRAARPPRRRRPQPVLGGPRPPLLRDGVLDRRLPDRHRAEVVHRRADAQASGLREPAAGRGARRDRRGASRHRAGARDARAGRLPLRRLRRHLRRRARRSSAFATTSTRCASRRCCR